MCLCWARHSSSHVECAWQLRDNICSLCHTHYFLGVWRRKMLGSKSDLCVGFLFFCFVFLLLFLCWWPWRSTVPPSVTLHQQLIGAPLGSTVSLDCTIESSPAALHFWSRSDGTDLHEAAKYLMQSSSSIGPVVTPAMAGASQPTWPSFRTQVKTKNY